MPKLILWIALGLTYVAYWPVGDASFVYEDDVYLTVASQPLTAATVFQPRGLSFLSYRLNVLTMGETALDFHVVNVGLHVGIGLLVGLFAVRLTGSDLAGAISAAAFLVHPLNSQAVAYITGRADQLAALGVVAGLVIVAGNGGFRYRLILASILIGLGAWAKETALVGFPLVGLYLWLVRKELMGKAVLALAGVMTFLASPVLVMRVLTNPYVGESERNLIEYAATQSAAVWRYLGLVVIPSGLSVDHDFELVTSRIALVAIGTLLLAVIGLWLKRRDWPLAVFAALWIVVSVGPRFVIQIPEYLNEHQFYLSMVGVCLLIGLGVQRCEVNDWQPSDDPSHWSSVRLS